MTILVLIALLAACTGTDDGESGGARPPDAAIGVVGHSPFASDGDPGAPDSAYRWTWLPIGGGGFATGLSIHPSEPDVMYVRTDVAGAYRYVAAEGRWEQMLTADGFTTGDPEPNDYLVESLAVAPSDPDVVYLSVGDDPAEPIEDEPTDGTGRVLRSADGGRTWTPSRARWVIAGNGEGRQRSERLAVDPSDPDHVLLGTRQEGLWRSHDGGESWVRVPGIPVGPDSAPDPSGAGVTFVEWGHGSTTGVVWVAVAGAGIYQSEDAGESWSTVRRLEPGVAAFEGTYSGDRLLVAIDHYDDDRPGTVEALQIDAGEWTDLTPPTSSPQWSIAVVPDDPDAMVAAEESVRSGHLWRTSDAGRSWTQLDISIDSPDVPWLEASDLDEWMSIGRLVFDPHHEGRLWFAEGMGVWSADDVFVGTSVVWTSHVLGLEQTVAADLVAPPGEVPISAVADRQGFRHDDIDRYPGRTLVDERFTGGTGLDFSAGHPEVVVWVGAEYQRYWDPDRGGRGAISHDGGRTWTAFSSLTEDQFGGNVAISATDPDNIVWVPSYFINPWEYEGLPRGVFVTDDGGRSWTELDGIDGSHRFHRLVWWLTRRALASDRVDGGVFYLNDDEGRFLISRDGGSTWDAARFAPPCSEANACHVVGQVRAEPGVAGRIWSSAGTDGLYRTDDRGDTAWEKVPQVVEARAFDFGAPLPGASHPTVFLHGRVGTDPDLGVWRSSDDGESWELVARNPSGSYRGITVVSGDLDVAGRVYLGTHGTGFVYGDDSTLMAPSG